MRATWDVFCRVIDNYGDIGVTWRLARQLSQEHDFAVRLWVDNLQAFQRICSAVVTELDFQMLSGIQIVHWHDELQLPAEWHCGDVVIEAFACQLPDSYLTLMRQKKQLLWLNLEYLTAESWAAECHALPSLQPAGLKKYFFFPGFSEETGGLLREANLLTQRELFLSGQQRSAFLAQLGVQPQANARLISLFAYANAALPSWLQGLSEDSQTNHVLALQGPILSTLADYFEQAELEVGQLYQKGRLTVQVLPYIEQMDFDRLLWSCDFNCVRGEDSFVRAQWAGKPFIWHIYPQQEQAHIDKLSAFIALYNKDLYDDIKAISEHAWQAWNNAGDMRQAWQQLMTHEEALQAHAGHWLEQQIKLPDLATKLASFYQNSL